MSIAVDELQPRIGAEIRGVDLSQPLDDTTLAAIESAWAEHAVLVFPDQPITDEQHVAFSRRFGELEIFPQGDSRSSTAPEIFRVANTDEQGRILPLEDERAKFATLTWFWHTDSSYRPIPSKGAVLHGIQITTDGGDTLFANMCAAWQALPETRKRDLGGLTARHAFEHTRRQRDLPPMKPEELALVPAVRHPLVRNHPDGRKSLYISPPYMEQIGDLPPAETQALIDELVAHSTQDEFVYRHRWHPHDVLMWDNRCTMHVVTPYDSANLRRVMHRTAIAGEAPVV